MKKRLAALLAGGALMAVSNSALAWTPSDGDNDPDCTVVHWNGNPNFILDTSSGDFDTSAKVDALADVLDRIGAVGGAWIAPTYSTDPNLSPGLKNGESEIWFDSNLDHLGATSVQTGGGDRDCELIEANIRFNPAPGGDAWLWGVPTVYYDPTSLSGNKWFRPIALHELLHGMGLAHEIDAFAMMNYWDFAGGHGPFTNRAAAYMVEPLPDDREGLRALYGTAGTERDVAIINFYVNPYALQDSDGDGAYDVAHMQKLCMPAKGSGWSSDVFGDFCATSPATSVCPGDSIYTRFTVMNFGTSGHTLDLEAWFSLDDQWSSSGDTRSASVRSQYVGASNSYRAGKTFVVPNLTPLQWYYVIIRSSPLINPGEDSTQNNWMPLRGKIFVPLGC